MRQKGFTPILIAIVLALIGIVGVYYFGTKTGNFLPIPSPKNVPVTLSSPVPNTATSWKTYTNTKFGYSIAYPPGWYLDENDQTQTNAISIKNYLDSQLTNEESKNFLGGEKNSTDKMYVVLSVSDKKISSITTIIDWLKANTDYVSAMSGAPTSVKETTIAGYPGIILNYTGVGQNFYFRVGDRIFFSYFGPPSTSQPQSVFDKILSTFKLTQ